MLILLFEWFIFDRTSGEIDNRQWTCKKLLNRALSSALETLGSSLLEHYIWSAIKQ